MALPSALSFLKMHGQGNDFVVFDARGTALPALPELPELARRACDRHYGIGGDGLVLLAVSTRADYRMVMLNPDGSLSETCGNALCCLARLVLEQPGRSCSIETGAGVSACRLEEREGVLWSCIGMGRARFVDERQLPATDAQGRAELWLEGQAILLYPVSMGNPHGVVFGEQMSPKVFRGLAQEISVQPAFPAQANISHVTVHSPGEVEVLVYERGAGWTQACGSAACAVLAAGVASGRLSQEIGLRFPGGTVRVRQDDGGEITYCGQGVLVARGEWYP